MSIITHLAHRFSAAAKTFMAANKKSEQSGQRQYNSIQDAILAAGKEGNKKKERLLKYTAKAISRVRSDIKTWNDALASAQSDDPKNFALQLLFEEISLDALLTSQIGNRTEQVFSSAFSLLTEKGDIDQEETDLLSIRPAYRRLTAAGLQSKSVGYSLVELELIKKENGDMDVDVINLPKTNIVPKTGKFFPDYSEDTFIAYREMTEFGTFILEFNSGELGLMNKAVVHVLFKRFAQSCWSELCEIYGIPPRVMKTNTSEPDMLQRAEAMMSDMGAAAWFIIDETENFEFADGVATNGDVYNNLIKLCSNEICLLFSGAVIGQDTVNGNRSKEESSQNMLWLLVQSDMAMMEEYWNSTIIPAFVTLGLMKPGLRFKYNPTEDLDQLWKITIAALQYYNIDPEWVKKKFGVEITGERKQIAGTAGSQDTSKETVKQMLCAIFD